MGFSGVIHMKAGKGIIIYLILLICFGIPLTAAGNFSLGIVYLSEYEDLQPALESAAGSINTTAAAPSVIDMMGNTDGDNGSFAPVDVSVTTIKAFQLKDTNDPVVLEHLSRQYAFDAVVSISLSSLSEFYHLEIYRYSLSDQSLIQLTDIILVDYDEKEVLFHLLSDIYSSLHMSHFGFCSIDTTYSISSMQIDKIHYDPDLIVPLSDGYHDLNVLFDDSSEYSTTFYLREGEWKQLQVYQRGMEKEAVLVTSFLTDIDLSSSVDTHNTFPFLLPGNELPFVMELKKEGYLDTSYVIHSSPSQVEVKMKRVQFDPSVVILESQKLFYSSLARTALAAALSIVTSTLAEDAQPVHTLMNGVIVVSSIESVFRLFDYYNKSKYSIADY